MILDRRYRLMIVPLHVGRRSRLREFCGHRGGHQPVHDQERVAVLKVGAVHLEELALKRGGEEETLCPIRAGCLALIVGDTLEALGAGSEMCGDNGEPTGNGGRGGEDDGATVIIKQDLKDMIRRTWVQGRQIVHYAREVARFQRLVEMEVAVPEKVGFDMQED